MAKSIATIITETESLIKTVPMSLSNAQTIVNALQKEIDRLEDLYSDYSDDYKDANGFRPNDKQQITEDKIRESMAVHQATL